MYFVLVSGPKCNTVRIMYTSVLLLLVFTKVYDIYCNCKFCALNQGSLSSVHFVHNHPTPFPYLVISVDILYLYTK